MTTTRPMVDLLFEGDQPDMKVNPESKKELALRRELIDHFNDLYQQVPDVTMDAEQALEQGLIDEKKLAALYKNLTALLESDPSNARIILYLPFELLPRKNSSSRKQKALTEAENTFIDSYLKSWRSLFSEYDVRANFVDGNILEPELKESMPMVNKASHLIPELVERNLISMSEVIAMLEKNPDQTLKDSILNTLPVLGDRGLISADEWQQLLFSSDKSLVAAAFKSSQTLEKEHTLTKKETARVLELFDPVQYQDVAAQEMYLVFQDYFQGIRQLVEQSNVSPKDLDNFTQLLIAGTRFWSMNREASDVVAQMANLLDSPLTKALSSPANFKAACEAKPVQDWVRLWDKKFLDEAGQAEVPGSFSNEVMDTEKVWQKISQALQESKPAEGGKATKKINLGNVLKGLETEIGQITEQYDIAEPKILSEARIEWEKLDKQNQLLDQRTQELAKYIVSGQLDYTELDQLISGRNELHNLAGITTIGKAVEALTKEEDPRAKELCDHFGNILPNVWAKGSTETQDALISVLSRWKALGVIDDKYFEQIDLRLPSLDATNQLSPAESQEVARIITSIERDPELSKMVYPACLVFGSKVKGYGTKAADVDKAVFIRPEVDWKNRAKLKKLLEEKFRDKKGHGKVTEFWLEQDGNNLKVRDVPLDDIFVAEKDWVHVLFQAMWKGNTEQIKELQQQLLPWYLEARNMPEGDLTRKKWLRKMEREVCQYRLMHKGYSRFYPRQGEIETANSHLIDSESSFWDPGYRRLATKLFLRKVFLPTASSKKRKE